MVCKLYLVNCPGETEMFQLFGYDIEKKPLYIPVIEIPKTLSAVKYVLELQFFNVNHPS